MAAERPGQVAVTLIDERLAEEAAPLVQRLVADRVASQISGQVPTLWGPDAESEAVIRLSWTSLHET
ncbi:MAG: glucose-6-phosphate isomerase, partial [Actinomycetota bacterium]|nr:glucose-6-phosphate isomerase [Actinomycetota bacterium]